MSNSQRRDSLKVCGLVGLGLALPVRSPEAARAESDDAPYEGPLYVVFNASGGWDTTYLMDPKGVNEINRLYKEGDILTRGAHKFAPTKKHIAAGMSNEDFYAEFGDELLTFNGLDYSVNNHAPGALYGDRQARQHGLPDVRGARCRLQRTCVSIVVSHVRQLFDDGEFRRDVAGAVPAVAPETSECRFR